MFYLLNKPFDENSPLKLINTCDPEVFKQVPLIKMTLVFMDILNSRGPVKLTSKGNLPVKLVEELNELNLFRDKFTERPGFKIRSEEDIWEIHIMKILCILAGIIKKANNKQSITVKGRKLRLPENHHSLFRELFVQYTTKFNWAYNDGYGDHIIGRLGFAFSLELLQKYGKNELLDKFYGQKYLKAFPTMVDLIEHAYFQTAEEQVINCYSLRTFEYFMKLFGLAELIEKGEGFLSRKLYIKKKPVLDQLIRFEK